jgi:hypothetical protein
MNYRLDLKIDGIPCSYEFESEKSKETLIGELITEVEMGSFLRVPNRPILLRGATIDALAVEDVP